VKVLPGAIDIAFDFRIFVCLDDKRAEEMADQSLAQRAALHEQAEVGEEAEIFVDRHVAVGSAVVLIELLPGLDRAGDLQIGFFLEVELAVKLAREFDFLGLVRETGCAVVQRDHDELGDHEAHHGEQQCGPFAGEACLAGLWLEVLGHSGSLLGLQPVRGGPSCAFRR
jgi:hypothetical protein